MLQDFWKRIPWQVILLLFTIPFLLRNLLLPMFADDYSYAFIWDGDNLGNLMDNIGPREQIDNLSDIFRSQWSHYFIAGCGLLMFSPGSVNRELLDLKYNAPYCLPAEKLYTWEMFRDNFIEGFLPIIIWESFLFIPVLLSWRANYHLDKHILLFTSAGLMVLCAMMFAQYHGLKAIRTDRKVDWKIKNRESLYNKK